MQINQYLLSGITDADCDGVWTVRLRSSGRATSPHEAAGRVGKPFACVQPYPPMRRLGQNVQFLIRAGDQN